MNAPEDTLDLMVDEFKRIISNPDSTPEIKGICVRAISEILVRVPIIEGRDRLERELAAARAKLSERKTVHEWLNQIGAEDTEENGKPMCLLRRLAVQLGIQPYSVK